MDEQEMIREHLKKMFSFFLKLFLLPGKAVGVEMSTQNEMLER